MPPDDEEGKAKGGARKDNELQGKGKTFVIIKRHGILWALVFDMKGLLLMVATGSVWSSQMANIKVSETIDKHHNNLLK